MRRLPVFILLLCISALVFGQAEKVPGDLLVQFNNTNTKSNQVVDFLETKYAAQNLHFERCISKNLNVWLCRFNPASASETSMSFLLSEENSVKVAQPNRRLQMRETFPDDLYFPDQWNLHNTGQNSGLPDADIDAPEAWDNGIYQTTVAGDTIVMAIIDDGFDLNHDDLNFFKNYSEIPDNGIDDDGNGFVDDFDGWNAYSHNGNVRLRDHGTHVSGIAGAIGNNFTGVCGVTWGGRILPVSGTEEVEATLVECYDYVLTMRKLYNESNGAKGAYVVSTNLSWGVDNGDPNDFPIWCAMYDSLGAYGVLSAGATANANYNIDEVLDMPTACASPYLITVTNTTKMDEKHPSAGYGITTIDLGAPGTSIYNTRQGNSYGFKSGTSMSTPHVTAALAYLYSIADESLINRYQNDPEAICRIFRDALLNTTDTLETLLDITVTGGRLNLHKASEYILNPPPAATLIFDGDSLIVTALPGARADTVVELFNQSDFPAPVQLMLKPPVTWLNVSADLDTIPENFSIGVSCWFDAATLSPGNYFTSVSAMTSGVISEIPVRFTVLNDVGMEQFPSPSFKILNNPAFNHQIKVLSTSGWENCLVGIMGIDGGSIVLPHTPDAASCILTIPQSGVYIVSVRKYGRIIFSEKIIVK